MIKVFEFGNGSVLVNGDWLNRTLTLEQIKPPLGYVGRIKKGDLDGTEGVYSLRLTKKNNEDLLKEIKSELLKMNESSVLEYEGFVLDFSDFKIESVRIVINAIDEALRGCSQLALAC